MKYKVNWGDGVFAVPDIAADCLKLASGKAVKVLVYILKNKVSDIDLSSVGEAVGISADDAEDAVSYWQQVGVLYADGTIPKEFKNADTVKQNSFTANEAVSQAQISHEKNTKMIPPEEIAKRVKNSGELKYLFSAAENSFGRMLNYTEQRTLIWLNDYYGMPPDILMMIIDLSKQLNKANIGYIEKTAINWHEKNIITHEQASAEIISLQNYFSLEGQVSSKLELNRALTPTERKFVKAWAEKGFSIELIVYAYEKTVDTIGKVKFSYMDKILSSWYEKGIRTVSEARSDTFDPDSKTAAKTPKTRSKNENSKNTSEEHSYNLDLLVEHALNSTPKIRKK